MNIELYAVKNNEGKWFRRKGYGGSGETWVEDFTSARIYTKIGPARGIISFFNNNYPDYPPPKLVKLVITEQIELDETDRLQKSKEKKETAKLKREKRHAEYELEQAKKQLDSAKQRYEKAKK